MKMRGFVFVTITAVLSLFCGCTGFCALVPSGAYVGEWVECAKKIEEGKGSRSFPYKISKAEHLAFLAKEVNSGETFKGNYFILSEDIDLSGREWTAIGNISEGRNAKFSGNFDGAGKSIINLKIDKRSQSAQGLFGYVESANIQNLNVVSCAVNGKFDVAAIAGCAYLSAITGCQVRAGNINGQENVGTVAGRTNRSDLFKNLSDAKVSGILYSGGIAGNVARNSKVNKCCSFGEICGSGCVGGLVGLNDSSLVVNCFSRADIVGKSSNRLYAGGLIGSNCGKLKNSYSASMIICDAGVGSKNGVVGLLAGYNKGVIRRSYYSLKLNDISRLHAVGRGKGDDEDTVIKLGLNEKNTMKLMDSNKLFGVWGPDFWELNPHKNDGLPFLKEVPLP